MNKKRWASGWRRDWLTAPSWGSRPVLSPTVSLPSFIHNYSHSHHQAQGAAAWQGAVVLEVSKCEQVWWSGGGEGNYLLKCTATKIAKWWVTENCQPWRSWQWCHHKEEEIGGNTLEFIFWKEVEYEMGVRGQEIALSNEHDTSPLPTSPSTPSPGKGVLAALRDCLEMIHSADTVLHLLCAQMNQVSIQNSLCKALARVRFQNSSQSHLLTVFILNLPEKELPPKNQCHSTQFPKSTA